jgi:hypothetical protein
MGETMHPEVAKALSTPPTPTGSPATGRFVD